MMSRRIEDLKNASFRMLLSCGITTVRPNRINRMALRFIEKAPDADLDVWFLYLATAVRMTPEQGVNALSDPESFDYFERLMRPYGYGSRERPQLLPTPGDRCDHGPLGCHHRPVATGSVAADVPCPHQPTRPSRRRTAMTTPTPNRATERATARLLAYYEAHPDALDRTVDSIVKHFEFEHRLNDVQRLFQRHPAQGKRRECTPREWQPDPDFTGQFYARSTRSLLADVFWAVVEIFAPNCKAAKR